MGVAHRWRPGARWNHQVAEVHPPVNNTPLYLFFRSSRRGETTEASNTYGSVSFAFFYLHYIALIYLFFLFALFLSHGDTACFSLPQLVLNLPLDLLWYSPF